MPGANGDTRTTIVATAQALMSKRGYTAVGINDIVVTAGVPKGSFYHYFPSKDALGEQVMRSYFEDYTGHMDRIVARTDLDAAGKLLEYWRYWYLNETKEVDRPRCLAVKLGAEVADLSEPMRQALEDGTTAIIDRIARMLDEHVQQGSRHLHGSTLPAARSLYDLWLGASVRAKIDDGPAPLDAAMARTRDLLGI